MSVSAVAQDLPQTWEGTFDAGVEVGFVVHFEASDSGVLGTIDIPMQNAMGLPLSEISLEEETIVFSLLPEGAPPAALSVWTLNIDGESAAGTLAQGGQEFPVVASRGAAGSTGVTRPQTPQPPFPYRSQDVSFTNEQAGATLAGTLTVPDGEGPHPGVILVSGSGPQDRDSSVFGHQGFWVLADHLTRNGIAVLRYDDRGVGESTGGELQQATSMDFAQDAEAGLAFLAAQPEIDSSRVGIIGHSEGGAIAPVIAARNEQVAFIVMLAGPGVSGAELLNRQQADLVRAAGGTDEEVEAVRSAASAVNAAAAAEDLQALRETIPDLLSAQLAAQGQEVDLMTMAQLAAQAEAQFTLPWMVGFLQLDASEHLHTVTVPVLALNGTLDLQVAHDVNLTAIEEALAEAGNPDGTTLALDGLNHLFQPAERGTVEEYGQIETTFDPEALTVISDWIRQRTGL